MKTGLAKLEQRIEEIASELEHSGCVPVWAVASSTSVFAIANDGKEAFGPRGRIISAVICRLGPSLWTVQMLRALGIAITFYWWLRALPIRRVDSGVVEVFVGFGAGPEAQMYREFKAESDRPVAHVDQTNSRSLARVARPLLWRLLSIVWRQAELLVHALRSSTAPAVQEHVDLWLTSAAIRFCAYAYAKAWAEALPSSVRRIVFISPDIPAFAAIDSLSIVDGPVIEFWQHGLLQRSIIIPRFHKMVALDLPEAKHLQARVPAAAVNVRSRSVEIPDTRRTRRLLFASVYTSTEFDKANHLALIRDVFSWASQEGLKPIVRPHPREAAEFWATHFPEIKIDYSTEDFADCLVRWQPMFVISWFSTALIDALKGRVLPVLLTQGSENMLPNLVLPLAQLALVWPADRPTLSNLASLPEVYQLALERRRRLAFGADD